MHIAGWRVYFFIRVKRLHLPQIQLIAFYLRRVMRHADNGLAAQTQFLLRQYFRAINNRLGFGNGGKVLKDSIGKPVFGAEHTHFYLPSILPIRESRNNRATIAQWFNDYKYL